MQAIGLDALCLLFRELLHVQLVGMLHCKKLDLHQYAETAATNNELNGPRFELLIGHNTRRGAAR